MLTDPYRSIESCDCRDEDNMKLSRHRLPACVLPLGLLLLFLGPMVEAGYTQTGVGQNSKGIGVVLFDAATGKKTAKVPSVDHRRVVDYRMYRDYTPLPIDPRKPCNPCVSRDGGCSSAKMCDVSGFQGRPYRDREAGGCRCGRCCRSKRSAPNFSIYWPSALNAIAEEHHPVRAARRAENPDRFRINNLFDGLGEFALVRYQRCDNGHCGPGRDRYGCLGESRYLESRVAGVGLRIPGQPIPRGEIEYP